MVPLTMRPLLGDSRLDLLLPLPLLLLLLLLFYRIHCEQQDFIESC